MTTRGEPEPLEGYEPFFGLQRGALQPRSRPSIPVCQRLALGCAGSSRLRTGTARAAGRDHRRDRDRQDTAVPHRAAAASAQDISLGHPRPAARTRRPAETVAPGLRRHLEGSDQARGGEPARTGPDAARVSSARSPPSRRTPSSIIDEAQHLQPEVLEQVRLLSNIDDGHGTLLQIILVGQTDLEPLLSRPELRQLQQRVSRRFALEPLNRDEVKQYIEHRLALARDGKPPSQDARARPSWHGSSPSGLERNRASSSRPTRFTAWRSSRAALPRVINLLCDRSLEAGVRVPGAHRRPPVDPGSSPRAGCRTANGADERRWRPTPRHAARGSDPTDRSQP